VSAAHALAHTDAEPALHTRGKPQIDDPSTCGDVRSRPLFAAGCGTRLALLATGGARDISVATKSKSTTAKHSP
jgi:hypothetical protein